MNQGISTLGYNEVGLGGDMNLAVVKMRPMEPILTCTSLLWLCYLLALVDAENSDNTANVSAVRSKRSLGGFWTKNFVATARHQGLQCRKHFQIDFLGQSMTPSYVNKFLMVGY